MPKVLVTYFSQTGNTKKIAEAIHDSIDQDKVILPMDKVEDLGPYGLVFIGFPVQSHSVPYKAEVFLKKRPGRKEDRPVLHPWFAPGNAAFAGGAGIRVHPGGQSQAPRNVCLPGQGIDAGARSPEPVAGT